MYNLVKDRGKKELPVESVQFDLVCGVKGRFIIESVGNYSLPVEESGCYAILLLKW